MELAFPHGSSVFGGDKHYLGAEGTCWPCSHSPLNWPGSALNSSAPEGQTNGGSRGCPPSAACDLPSEEPPPATS